MTISIVLRMIIYEGNTIIEIEEVEVPTSKPTYQVVIAIFLYFYSIHRAYIENGLEAGPFPITFITIASTVSRANSMFSVIVFGSIIAIIDFFGLISYIRNSIRPTFKQRLLISISVIQNAIDCTYALSPNDLDKLLRWSITGINIMIEIMDLPALIIQHDVMNTFFVAKPLEKMDARCYHNIFKCCSGYRCDKEVYF